MKLAIRIAVAALVISTFAASIASAMVRQDDLKNNLFPDEGISSKLLSDIDTGVIMFGDNVPGLSDLDDGQEPITQRPQQLLGKHII